MADSTTADAVGLLQPDARAPCDVFVSYSRADLDRARELVVRLESAGRTVWVDWSGIPPTAEWMTEVRNGMDACHAVLFVLSPSSLASAVCEIELTHAVESGKRIVPVVVADVGRTAVPESLAARQWIFARPSDDLDAAIEQVREGLALDIDAVRAHTRILTRSREWRASGEDASLLLRGRDLEAAERWLAAPGSQVVPTAEQTTFVVASRRVAVRRSRRLTGVVAAVLAASLLLAGFAVVQRNDARDQSDLAHTQAAAATAITQLGADPELSLLLAEEAARTGRTPQSDDALRRSLVASHLVHVLAPAFEGQNTSPTVTVGFTSDGTRLVTGGNDMTARVWDSASGSLLGTVPSLPQSQGQATATGTSSVVQIDGQSGAIVIDAATLRAGAPLVLPQRAYAVEPGHDRGSVVLTFADGTVRALDVGTGELGPVLARVAAGAYDAAVAPDGATIAVAAADGAVHIMRSSGPAVLVRHDQSAPYTVRWSPDGRTLGATWSDGSATLIDVDRGSVAAVLVHDASVTDLRWTATAVVTGDSAGVVRAWDPDSARVVAELRGHTAYVPFLAVTSDGQRVASSSYDNTARVWRLAGTIPTSTLTTGKPVVGLAPLPDGRTAVVSQSDGTVQVLDLRTGAVSRVLDRAAPGVPALSADGRLAALIATAPEPQVRVVDVATGRLVRRLTDLGVVPGGGGSLPAMAVTAAFDPQGTRLAVATENGVRVLDIATGRVIASLSLVSDFMLVPTTTAKDGLLPRRSVVWNTTGTLVGVTAGTGARLWNPLSDKVERWFEGHAQTVQGLALDPTDHLVVTASVDKTARVYDIESSAVVAVLRGHTGEVLTAAFSPSGRHVVTTGLDGTARVWDLAGTELATYPVASVIASSARFIGDDEHLLVTGQEGVNFTNDPIPTVQSGSVSFYDCEVCAPRDALLALARDRVTRDLSAEERAILLDGAGGATTSGSTTPVEVAPQLVGRWTTSLLLGSAEASDWTIELQPGGTVLGFSPSLGFTGGTYRTTGSTIEFTGVGFDCPGGDGKYTVGGSAGTVVLTPARPGKDCPPMTLRPEAP